MIIRNDDYAARMLTGGALYTCAAFHQVIDIVLVSVYMIVFDIVLDVSEGSLVSDRRNGAGLIYVLLTEDLSNVSVSYRLVFTRKVEVYIRFFISFEPEECGERDVEAFLFHTGAALRTGLVRHVVADVVFARLIRPLKMPALRANIMRCERVDLRYACHGGCKR